MTLRERFRTEEWTRHSCFYATLGAFFGEQAMSDEFNTIEEEIAFCRGRVEETEAALTRALAGDDKSETTIAPYRDRWRAAEASLARAIARGYALSEAGIAFYRDKLREAEVNLSNANADNRRLRVREAFFAEVLSIADGGRYRADWPGAIERCIRDRDMAIESTHGLALDYGNALACIRELQRLHLRRALEENERITIGAHLVDDVAEAESACPGHESADDVETCFDCSVKLVRRSALAMAVLDAVRTKGKAAPHTSNIDIILKKEDADRVEQLLEDPPQPSETLRALLCKGDP